MLTLHVAAVSDGTVPQEMVADELNAASTVLRPLDITVEMSTFEVRTDVTTHTNPNALLADFRTQIDGRSSSADVTVLFTTRSLHVGSTLYAGLATTGPACSASQVALVASTDYRVTAHELAHTLGIEHDTQPGYLMAADGYAYTDTLSAQSVAQFNGQFHDCLTAQIQAPAIVSKTAPASSSGGGGGFGLIFIVLLAGVALTKRMVNGPCKHNAPIVFGCCARCGKRFDHERPSKRNGRR